MQLTTIEMAKTDAEAALAEWEAELTRSRSDEDAAIVDGYRALAKGDRLIRLSDTIRAGGEDEGRKPRLAVAPAVSTTIFLTRDRIGDVRFSRSDVPKPWTAWGRDISLSAGVQLAGVLPAIDDATWNDEFVGYNKPKAINRSWDGACLWSAVVPVVPPRFRRRGWKSCFVLFEAEWARHDPPAPVDPALIRHLRGDLWVVLGVWDLTELERAVLMGRNS